MIGIAYGYTFLGAPPFEVYHSPEVLKQLKTPPYGFCVHANTKMNMKLLVPPSDEFFSMTCQALEGRSRPVNGHGTLMFAPLMLR